MMLILIGLGAMSIAAWLYVRFPSVAPDDLRVAILHVLSASLVAKVLVPILASYSGAGSPAQALFTLFAIAFPALVYLLLSGLWMLRLAQQTLSMGR